MKPVEAIGSATDLGGNGLGLVVFFGDCGLDSFGFSGDEDLV